MNRPPDLRECGYDEGALFAFLDGDQPEGERLRFKTHLAFCPPCARDVDAYAALDRALSDLPGLDPRPGFDERILAALAPAPASAGARPDWWQRLVGGPLPGFPGRWGPLARAAGLVAAGGAIVSVALAFAMGGPGQILRSAAGSVAVAAANILSGGVRQLLDAVKLSDVIMRVALQLEPVWRSLSHVSNAVGAEFWLFSTLASLLALLGAVRLATGQAMEREVRRVSVFL